MRRGWWWFVDVWFSTAAPGIAHCVVLLPGLNVELAMIGATSLAPTSNLSARQWHPRGPAWWRDGRWQISGSTGEGAPSISINQSRRRGGGQTQQHELLADVCLRNHQGGFDHASSGDRDAALRPLWHDSTSLLSVFDLGLTCLRAEEVRNLSAAGRPSWDPEQGASTTYLHGAQFTSQDALPRLALLYTLNSRGPAWSDIMLMLLKTELKRIDTQRRFLDFVVKPRECPSLSAAGAACYTAKTRGL